MSTNVTRQCLPQMQVCAIRVCELDDDGTTKIGTDTAYVSDAVVSLGITPVVKDGTNISESDGCGVQFIDVNSDPALTRYDVDIDVWSTDPHFLNIVLPGGDILTGGSGEVGFAYPGLGTLVGKFSLEFWQKIIENNTQDANFPWAHWALPLLKNIKLGKRDIVGNAVSHTVLTAEAYENDNWFNGPANDWAVASDKAVQWIPKATLPTATCTPLAITS